MKNTVRIATLALLGLVGCAHRPPVPAESELYQADPPEVILDAARALMEADENVALLTVDSAGQPRVRSVRAFLSDVDPTDARRGMTVWVMTRESTRKVKQILEHPRVTLYFNDDDAVTYLTIMGKGVIHTDPASPKVQPFLMLEGYKEFFWPEFPKGFVMIEVEPQWIEFMGPGVRNHTTNWRPQSVLFPAEQRE